MLGIGFEQADELDAPFEREPLPVQSRRRTLLMVLVGGALLWCLIGWVIVPAAVRNLSAAWGEVARQVLLGWVALAALAWATTSRVFVRRIVGRTTPGALGAIRMIVCFALFMTTLGERAADVADIAAWERGDDMGVMRLLFALPLGLNDLSANGTSMLALKAVTLALLAAAMIGWRTRIVLPAAAVCWFILAGVIRSHLSFTHNGIVPFYLLAILCFTRCADGFSLDRMLRVARGLPVVPADARRATYAWGRYAVWVAVVLFYVAAGMSKLRIGGWMWWDGRNIQAILFSGAFRGFPGDFPIMSMDWIPMAAFSAMGLLTLATELGMVLVLVSARARTILPLMALGMHVGIRAVQKIRFYDLMVLQLIFYDWTRIRRWVGEQVRRRWGRLVVRLDARDSRAARAAELLRGCDLFELLEIDVTPQPFAVTRERDGRAFTARQALAALAVRVPLLWPLAVLLRLPLFGSATFSTVSTVWNRYGRTRGDVARAPLARAPLARAPLVRAPLVRAPRPFAWPIVVPVLTVVLLACCLFGVEQYPFTSMRMYARSNHSGVHTYTRMFMTTASGEVQQVYLNRFGGTVKRFNQPMSEAFRGGPRARAQATALLQHWTTQWNRNVEPESRAVAVEIQKIRWDFINNRDDPHYGDVADRLVVNVEPSRHPNDTAAAANH
jgi:hypothetical protein